MRSADHRQISVTSVETGPAAAMVMHRGGSRRVWRFAFVFVIMCTARFRLWPHVVGRIDRKRVSRLPQRGGSSASSAERCLRTRPEVIILPDAGRITPLAAILAEKGRFSRRGTFCNDDYRSCCRPPVRTVRLTIIPGVLCVGERERVPRLRLFHSFVRKCRNGSTEFENRGDWPEIGCPGAVSRPEG